MDLEITSKRLRISQLRKETSDTLSSAVITLLTPSVTEYLPPNFHGINTAQAANNWLLEMTSQSQLFQIANEQNQIIGFIFGYESAPKTLQLGYLLGEHFWRQGYAFEMLSRFIQYVKDDTKYTTLLAGVNDLNQASVLLLVKLGFTKISKQDDEIKMALTIS